MDHSDTRALAAPAAPTSPPRKKRPEPQRHQWFDAWRVAKGGGLRALVDRTVGFQRHDEEHTKKRVRARRPTDAQHHVRRIEAVVCNLAHAVLMPPDTGRIAVKLGNQREGRSRYDSPVFGKTLSPLISGLRDLDFLDLKWSTLRGEVSSIAPSPWFSAKVAEFGVALSDFGRDETEDVIILTRNTRRPLDGSKSISRKIHREPIDYGDTSQTRQWREDLRGLNAFLAQANIDFLDDGLRPRVDPFERTMRRRFLILQDQEVRFDQGGRLFGGFWQTLKSDRRQHIRIDGEPVAVLDYGSMFTRLAYAELGATPPPVDLYAIPGLEGYRSGVKLAMNTLLFDGGPRRSWPSEVGVGVGDDDAATDPRSEAASFQARLPEGWGVATTKKAILGAHPALKQAWGRSLGYRLMFMESDILIAVLQSLAEDEVAALGLHDGLMVALSKAEKAQAVMSEAARTMTGHSIPVSHKLTVA